MKNELSIKRFQFIIVSLLGVLIKIPSTIYCQEQAIYHNLYSSENGLSQNTIDSIAKDKNGFIWIGTQSGLIRFDGYNFKKWFQETVNQNSLELEIYK